MACIRCYHLEDLSSCPKRNINLTRRDILTENNNCKDYIELADSDKHITPALDNILLRDKKNYYCMYLTRIILMLEDSNLRLYIDTYRSLGKKVGDKITK